MGDNEPKFKPGDYICKKWVFKSVSDQYEPEDRYYLILKVFEDAYGYQYRCQRFTDGVADNYTAVINAKLLEDGGKLIAHIDFSQIQKQAEGECHDG